MLVKSTLKFKEQKRLEFELNQIESGEFNGLDLANSIGVEYFQPLPHGDEIVEEINGDFILNDDFVGLYIKMNFYAVSAIYQKQAEYNRPDFNILFSDEDFRNNINSDKDLMGDNFHAWTLKVLKAYNFFN